MHARSSATCVLFIMTVVQNKNFWRACERGDLGAVKEAIGKGEVDLNWRSAEDGYKVLSL